MTKDTKKEIKKDVKDAGKKEKKFENKALDEKDLDKVTGGRKQNLMAP